MRIRKAGVGRSAEDCTITYCNETLPARLGESVAAALIASGRYAFRTTRGTGERGVFCGMGVCSECAVTIDGRSGQLACMVKVAPGMTVTRNPPAVQLDDEPAPSLPEEVLTPDVLVIGGGPGGLSAALAAARSGADVVMVDERGAAGGQYFKQPTGMCEINERALDNQYRAGRVLLGKVSESGARLLLNTRVWGGNGPYELYAVSDKRRLLLRASTVVLATGAFERGVPFPGWTLPGVMTTGAAQTLLRSHLVSPGRRVLVSGNGPLNLQVAAELATAGVEVVAVAELSPIFQISGVAHLAAMSAAAPTHLFEGLGYLRVLVSHRVPILAKSSVIKVQGEGRAETASVASIDSAGHPVPGTDRIFAVDAVCVGFGFVPATELARSFGCACRIDVRSGALFINRDRRGRSSVPGVWIVGDGGAVQGADVAQAMGTLAGLDAAASLGRSPVGELLVERRRAERALARGERFQRSLWEFYDAPRLVDQLASPDTVICRCEEVTFAQLDLATPPWLAAAGSIKRATRAGMGKCQGRYCSPILIELAARAAGVAPGVQSGFAPQAPYLPVPVRAVASQSAEPGHQG